MFDNLDGSCSGLQPMHQYINKTDCVSLYGDVF